MLLCYQPRTPDATYSIAWSVGGSARGSVFLTPSAALSDGRTGSGTLCQWITGTQNTSSYVDITGVITDPVHATAVQGAVGVANIVGLPIGTKIVVNGITQRVVAGVRGEACAWFLPAHASNAIVVRIYNDVNGVASIAADAEFLIGEIFVGQLINLCVLASSSPKVTPVDPTSVARTAGSNAWPLMRKPYKRWSGKLGPFTTSDLYGGSASSIPSGDGATTIDIETLAFLLSTAAVCAVCPNPQPAFMGSRGGVDQDFMQQSFFVARPSSLDSVTIDMKPRGSWTPTFDEAT